MTQPIIKGTGHGHPVMPFGSDGSDHYEIYVDSEGVVRVRSADGDKIEGFESIVEEEVENLALAAGTNTLSGTPVPSGKIWKITQLSFRYTGTVTSVALTPQVVGLAGNLRLNFIKPPVSGTWYFWSGNVYLQAGDYIALVITSATLNDDAVINYAGLQMNAP